METEVRHSRRDHMYIFTGTCYGVPFQFVVFARTEENAKQRLLMMMETAVSATAMENTYHEFMCPYAVSVKDVMVSTNLSNANRPDTGLYQPGEFSNFRDFVTHSKVIVKDPMPILFSSGLDS